MNITVAIGRADLLVSSEGTNGVLRYDQTTGAFIGAFVNSGRDLTMTGGEAIGPDGNLYVRSNLTNQILRYSGSTGQFLGVLLRVAAWRSRRPSLSARTEISM